MSCRELPEQTCICASCSHYFLSVQQPSVLGDLPLEPVFDVEQHLVFLPLPLNVGPHLAQLVLQLVDDGLELAQMQAVAGLGLHELALQGLFLPEEEEEEQ